MENKTQRQELEYAIDMMKGHCELFEQNISELDKLFAFRHKDLVEKGFTREEALSIILSRGIG